MEPTFKLNKKLLWPAALLPLLSLACGLFTPSASISEAPVAPNQRESQPQEVQVVQPTPQLAPVPQAIVDEQSLLINLYQRVNPSVVNITVYARQGGDMMALGQGSGFVYDAQGHIITNAHVVHGSDQVDVTFPDDTVRPGKVVGEDLNSDLAVVKVDLPEGVGPLPLGDLDQVQVGQTVIAIGNPFGLNGTLTRGIVSAIGRTIPALTVFSIPKAIQTDAAINPGNSGGPLLNLQGEVIGVNAQIETSGTSNSNSGVGFAIPVSIVQQVAPKLIENGKYDWAWLGVRGGDLTQLRAQAMNLPVEKGAYIAEIVSGGPAERAKLKGSNDTTQVEGRTVDVGGDVVVAIDGQPVNSFDDMLIYIALSAGPGQDVTLSIYRDGKLQDVTVKLEARPDQVPDSQQPFFGAPQTTPAP